MVIDVSIYTSSLLSNLPTFQEVLMQDTKEEAIDPQKTIGE